jgi:molybdopterin-binding protein
MKISARNQLKGTVVDVAEGQPAIAVIKASDVLVAID